MRQLVLDTLFWLLIGYWTIYIVVILHNVIVNGFDASRLRIASHVSTNSKLMRGFIIGFMASIDLFLLYHSPTKLVEMLGFNKTISPYIFYGIIMVAFEGVLYALIFMDLKLSELSLGSVKLSSKNEDIVRFTNASNERLNWQTSKLLASYTVLTDIAKYGQNIYNVFNTTNSLDSYAQEIQKILDDYVALQTDKEKGLRIKIHYNQSNIYDTIKSEYKMCNYSISKIEEQMNTLSTALVEEPKKSLMLIDIKSSILTQYYVVIYFKESSVRNPEEATIVATMLYLLEQYVEAMVS